MALTRSALREKGITEKEILDYIMDENGLSVEAAKEKAKEATEAAAQKKIDGLQAQLDASPKPDPEGKDWKVEHDSLKAKYDTDIAAKDTEFSTYKASIEDKETTATIMSDIESRLIKDGAKPSLVKLLLKEIDAAKAEYKDGTVTNYDDLTKPIKDGYADIFGQIETRGVDQKTPPPGGASSYTMDDIKKMSPQDINKNWDTIKSVIEKG